MPRRHWISNQWFRQNVFTRRRRSKIKTVIKSWSNSAMGQIQFQKGFTLECSLCFGYWSIMDDYYSLFPKNRPNFGICFGNHSLDCYWSSSLSPWWRVLTFSNRSFWRGGHWLKIVVAVICFLLAILLLVMVCMYSSEVKFQGIMLEYATRFLNENPCTFAYIPVFLLFAIGLIALILWQQACFSSWWGDYVGFGTGGVWGVLNVLEFIWGLQFLRDACKQST